MTGPHVDPGWQGGSGAWQGGSHDARPQPDTSRAASLDPNEFVKKRREPIRRPKLQDGHGSDAAQTAVMAALQMVKMSFVAAWKMFTFMIRIIMK